jgi:hypothetical protein
MKGISKNPDHAILMFNPIDMDVFDEDGKYVFVGKTYGSKIVSNENMKKTQDVLSKFPRFNHIELSKAKDGVYTWLMYSTGNRPVIRFVATEVVSPFEIGTRHQALAYNSRIDASTIYAGGELVKKDGTITFNLRSGTYSKPILVHNFNKSLQNEMIRAFQVYFPDAEYDTSGSSYVYNVSTVPNTILQLYKDIGYTVRLFDTRKDYIDFSNKFWNLDFTIDHAHKKMTEETNDIQKSVWRNMYVDNIQGLIDLLQTKKGGVRKTRRNKKERR